MVRVFVVTKLRDFVLVTVRVAMRPAVTVGVNMTPMSMQGACERLVGRRVQGVRSVIEENIEIVGRFMGCLSELKYEAAAGLPEDSPQP